MPSGLRLLIAGLLALQCCAVRLPIRIYRTTQGLPRNSVTCMVAGQNGVMWFCGTEGLVRFDGYNFRVFGPDQGLPSHVVFTIARSRSGGYWLVTNRGLCRLAPGSEIGEPCKAIPAPTSGEWLRGYVAESASGEVWAANDQRVYRVRPDGKTLEAIRFPIKASDNILGLYPDDGGRLLIAVETGLWERSSGGQLRLLTGSIGNPGVGALVRHRSGDYWLATAIGLYRMRLSGPERIPEFRGDWFRPTELSASLIERKDGTLWLTMGGVNKNAILELGIDAAGDARIVRRMGPENGLPVAPLQKLTEDEGGRLWISTEGEGVLRIEDNGFVAYGEDDGLGTGRIASLFQDIGGRLCVMTTWDGKANLRAWRGDRFEPVPIRYPPEITAGMYGGGWNQFGFQAHDGEWWIPSDNGLLRFAASSAEALPHTALKHWYREEEGACRQIFRVFEDSRGDIWASCGGARPRILRWNRASDRFREFGAEEGWPGDQVATVFRESAGGTLWIGTNSGLVRFRNRRFQAQQPAAPAVTAYVRDLLIDSAGRVWVATAGKGLYRCDDAEDEYPRFSNYTPGEGIASLYLRALSEDRAGLIYVSSVRGVDRLDPRASPEMRRVRHFNADDGLPDSEHNVSITTRDGHVWFGTLHGLSEYDPSRSRQPSKPGVYFTRIMVRGEEVPIDWDGTRHAAFSLAPDRNQIQVEFAGSDSGSLSALLYQYRLIGSQDQWSEPSSQLRVNYSALPAGRLRFEVRAVNPDGQFSEESAALDLDVAAPLWRRGWFLLLVALAVGGAATAGYRYRVEQLLTLERLRTRIAVDLHDDIGANLSQIAILSEVARRDPERGSLEVIPAIARETVEDMSDIVWAINPRHDRMDALLHRMRRYADDTLGGVGIELSFESGNLPADLTTPIEARRPLYLVFKEAVNNAARHSGAKHVTIRMEVDRAMLRMTIEDDGRGFDPGAEHEGEGVNSIGRRMRALGGTAEWTSLPGQGARLVAALPIRNKRGVPGLVGRIP